VKRNGGLHKFRNEEIINDILARIYSLRKSVHEQLNRTSVADHFGNAGTTNNERREGKLKSRFFVFELRTFVIMDFLESFMPGCFCQCNANYQCLACNMFVWRISNWLVDWLIDWWLVKVGKYRIPIPTWNTDINPALIWSAQRSAGAVGSRTHTRNTRWRRETDGARTHCRSIATTDRCKTSLKTRHQSDCVETPSTCWPERRLTYYSVVRRTLCK